MIIYPCSHCGKTVSLDCDVWLDSGTTLFCSKCDGPTIVDLRRGVRLTTAAPNADEQAATE